MDNKVVTEEALLELMKGPYKSKTTGIVTGCFDVLHTGHIELFQFAKKNVDILIVGIDTDIAIRKTKGESRPINNQKERAKMLASIMYVDNVLLLSGTHEFSTKKANDYYDNLIIRLNPQFLITSCSADKFWKVKKERIERAGGNLLLHKKEKNNSTSNIINKILKID